MNEETKVIYEKPIPLKNTYNAPYWDAADRHELNVQKCNACGIYNHPPGPSCANCGSIDVIWENLGSNIKGEVYTYIVSHRPFLPGFQNDLPTVIAVVQLEDYPEIKIIANVLNGNAETVSIGTKVKMVWVEATEERSIPQWVFA